MTQHPQCKYLLRRGMSVLCIDSTDPPRRTDCDHCIDTICFGSHPHTPAAPDCITCPKPAIGYGIGIDEARLTQCNTCMFDGKRECMYHGYPDDTIPQSCEYKIGKHAVIAPIEAQMHNREHDATIRNQTLDAVKEYADTCIWIDDDCCPGKVNDKEESDCDGCSYVDYPNNADICEKIESLRTQSTEAR